MDFSGDVSTVNEDSLSPDLLPESKNKSCALESVSVFGNLDDKSTGAPNIVRTTELSLRENEKEQVKASIEEGINGSTGQNAPVSEVIDVDANNVLSISGNPKENDTSKVEKIFAFEISSLADMSRNNTCKNSEPFPSISAGKVTPVSCVVHG